MTTQLSDCLKSVLSNAGLFCWFKKLPTSDCQCFSNRVLMEKICPLIPLPFALICLQKYSYMFLVVAVWSPSRVRLCNPMD